LRLPRGTYYWSVQAVDGGYRGSAFAPEQTFTVTRDFAPRATEITHPAAEEIHVRFLGCLGINYMVQRSDDLLQWLDIGVPTETSPGVFEYVDFHGFTGGQRFWRVRFN